MPSTDSTLRIPQRELHRAQKALNRRSVEELIRLLRSERLFAVTAQHLRTLGEYQAIEIAGEQFFSRAFSTGKEVAWSLALALELGPGEALKDLLALRASMLGPDPAAPVQAAGSAPMSSSPAPEADTRR